MAEQDRLGAHLAPGEQNVRQAGQAAQDRLDPLSSHRDIWGSKLILGNDGHQRLTQLAATKGNGSEVDRYGKYFSIEHDRVERARRAIFEGHDASEQNVWERHFGLGGDANKRLHHALHEVKGAFDGSSGAEQDRYGARLQPAIDRGVQKAKDAARDALPAAERGAEKTKSAFGGWFSGRDTTAAEQDTLEQRIQPAVDRGLDKAKHALGRGADKAQHAYERSVDKAERAWDRGTDKAENAWNRGTDKAEEAAHRAGKAFNSRDTSYAEQDTYGRRFQPAVDKATDKVKQQFGSYTEGQYQRRADFDRTGAFGHSHRVAKPLKAATVGILESTILPSFTLHGGLAAVAYGVARYYNRVEVKDYLWPSAQVLNAWWSAVGRHIVDGVPIGTIFSALSYQETLLLGGVTAWGLRLLYRVATRSLARGEDDPRYTEAKKQSGFWNDAAWKLFLPEAIVQTIISLPFTLPFRDAAASNALSPIPAYGEVAHILAVATFATGLAMEATADTQLAAHAQNKPDELNREGIWSVVRHPNYLGDTLIHASFPLILYSCGMLHPAALLGPLANYIFLRQIGGDKENEASQLQRYKTENPVKYHQFQAYTREKNSFWPRLEEFANPALLSVVGVGLVSAVVEKGIRGYLFQ